jgi:hypothetical protein
MTDLTPRTLTIQGVTQMYGWGRTTTYELLGAGKLEAVKVSGRLLIFVESCERLLASAPRAEIRPRHKKCT